MVVNNMGKSYIYIYHTQDKAIELVKEFFSDVDNDYGYILNSNKKALVSDLITYLEYHLNKKGKVK